MNQDSLSQNTYTQKKKYIFFFEDEGVFISPKVYGGINSKYEYVKVKGLKNPISFAQLKSLLKKDQILNITQEKWYRNISEGNIRIMNEIYTLIATENKRKLIYDGDILIGTEPFVIEEDESNKK